LNRSIPYKRSRIAQVHTKLKAHYTKQLNIELEKIERLNDVPDSLPNDLTLIINFISLKRGVIVLKVAIITGMRLARLQAAVTVKNQPLLLNYLIKMIL